MRNYINRTDIDTVFFNARRVNDEIIGIYEKILDIEPTSEKDIVRPYLKNILRIIEDVELNAYEKIIRIEDSINQDLESTM